MTPLPQDVQPLDRIDRALVEALQRDGRTPNNELARLAGIAPSTCLARVRSLRDRGVVRGIHADVDPVALGHTIQAMIAVSLRPDARASLAGFAEQLTARPFVLNAYYVSGSYDHLLHVACAGTDALRDIVNDLSAMPQVASTETHLIFEHRTGRQA